MSNPSTSQAYTVKIEKIRDNFYTTEERYYWTFETVDENGNIIPHTEQRLYVVYNRSFGSEVGKNEWQRSGYQFQGSLEQTEKLLPAFMSAVEKQRELNK